MHVSSARRFCGGAGGLARGLLPRPAAAPGSGPSRCRPRASGTSAHFFVLVPLDLWLFLAAGFAGAAVLVCGFRVGDKFFGVSLAHLIAEGIRWLHTVRPVMDRMTIFSAFCLLGDIAGEDVELIAGYALGTKDGAPKVATAVPPETTADGRSYEEAVSWLQRPSVSISLADQMRLHSLWARASESKGVGPRPLSGTFLQRAQREASRALGDLCPTAARRQLPLALAVVEPSFAAPRPHLRPPHTPARSFWTVVLHMLERRWTSALEARAAKAQLRLFAGCCGDSVLAASFSLRRVAQQLGISIRLAHQTAQVNLPNLSSREMLVRRLIQIEFAVERDPKATDFTGLNVVFSGPRTDSGGASATRFSEWIAGRQRDRASILKQTRLFREEQQHDRKHRQRDRGGCGGGDDDGDDGGDGRRRRPAPKTKSKAAGRSGGAATDPA